MIRRTLFLAAALGVAAMLPGSSPARQAATAAQAAAEPIAFRRLNETQYSNAVRDIFGADIKIPGRFDPPWRESGLLAIGDAKVAITSSSLEQDELRARNIAAQAFDAQHRGQILSCKPVAVDAFDRDCASRFIGKYGRLLYRRPLDDGEMTSVVNVVEATTRLDKDFAKGLEAGLARLLASPNFLFRIEWAERDPQRGARRLDAFSLATRLSFMLWNAPPDEALLDAAAKGALRDKASLDAQVDRLTASPRFEQGIRAFFSDMLAYEGFDGLSKDQGLFPVYTSQIAKDAREQTLRTIVDLLLTNKGDYRDLFTTKKTFMNRNLGGLYGVPIETAAVGGWAPYTFAPDDQRAGLLTLAAFLMLDPSHEGRSSPTNRGKALRERFLCQPIPSAPGNVDFAAFEQNKGGYKTARERLATHRANPVCAGCHALTDPIGLALENYDSIGNFRATENDVPIDASGAFEGKAYKSAVELQALLHDSPELTSCVAQKVYEYGVGRPAGAAEQAVLKGFEDQFASQHYVFVSLVRTIATSDAFQAVSPSTIASN